MTKAQLAEFDRWYKHYARKQNPKKAREAFAKLDPSPELVERMIEAADIQKEEYLKEKGPQSGAGAWRYMPLPASWINAEAWDNEVVVKRSKAVKKTTLCAKCHLPATNQGKLGVWYCVDHWDAGDPERADFLKNHFISLGIKQENGSWREPCMRAMKSMAFGKLIGRG